MQKINLEKDIEELAKGREEGKGLSEIAIVAQTIIRLEKELDELEEVMQKRGEELMKLTMQVLPELMASFGLSEFTLTSGETIKVKPFINGSIPSESAIEKAATPEEKQVLRDRMERAFAFLNANNGAALIKSNLRAELGKGAQQLALKAVEALNHLGVLATVTRGVHPQTLNAWIRERLAKGLPVDMEILRVHVGKLAEIKQPK